MSDNRLNETAGRTSPHEPTPSSITVVFCVLKGQRVNITEAQASYTSHHDDCINCQECQEGRNDL